MKIERKKILVVNPISLFPTVMMSQIRALNQVFSFTKYHDVDVVTFVKNEEQKDLSNKAFKNIVNQYYPVHAINFDSNKIRKNYYNLKFILLNRTLGIRVAVSNLNSKYSRKVIKNLINSNRYDVVISHYWYSSFFFLENFKYQFKKILDLHGMVDEDIELNTNSIFYRENHNLEKKINIKNLQFQKKIYEKVDVVVPNSLHQVKILEKKYPNVHFHYCPNGQDMDKFVQYRNLEHDPNTILFYGTLNSLQNKRAFDMFYKNIWPKVLKKNSNAKLLIVGNRPPEEIKTLNNKSNITVTGYVDDVKEYISKSCCMVLPMDIGIGFRGRVVESMALGVPVVGNYNALDCIGLENEINGFITDDFDKMADYTIRLISDPVFRKQISENAIDFIEKKYSMSATFDKFSQFITTI